MQCVILAAGKGTRLMPLTENIPKPLVKVHGRPLLDHIVASLPSTVTELVIVTGYLEEQLRAHCGQHYFGRPVTYVHQAVPNGTATALWLCRDFLKGRFLFMFADDIHGANDLEAVSSHERALLAMPSLTPERFGVVLENPDGTLAGLIEKPTNPPSNLVSTGPMVLDRVIFDFELGEPVRGEYYLPEVVERYAKQYPMRVVKQSFWLPVGYPEDIAKAESILKPD